MAGVSGVPKHPQLASGPPRARASGDEAGEAEVGQRHQAGGRRRRMGQGHRARATTSAAAPVRTRARPARSGTGTTATSARAVSIGRATFATPATTQEDAGRQVRADQFHGTPRPGRGRRGVHAQAGQAAALTRGTSTERRAWLPSTA